MAEDRASTESPPAPPIGSPPICRSRDEILRRELKHFTQRTLRRELRDFGTRLQNSISEDLQRVVASLAPGLHDGNFSTSSNRPLGMGAMCVPIPEVLRNAALSNSEESTSSIGPLREGSPSQLHGCLKKNQHEPSLDASKRWSPALSAEGTPRDPPSKKQAKTITFEGVSTDEEAQKEMMNRILTGTGFPSASSSEPSSVAPASPLFENDGFAQDEPEESPALPGAVTIRKSLSRCTLDHLASASEREKLRKQGGGSRPSKRATRMDSAGKNRQTIMGASANQTELPTFFGFKRETRVSPRKDKSGTCTTGAEADGTVRSSTTSWTSIASLHGLAKWQDRLQAMVLSHHFDWAFGFLVFLQGMIIGIQTDYIARNGTDVVPTAFRVVDITFCLLFNFELIMRVMTFGRFFFGGEDWRWNLFDVGMVLLQNVEEITHIITLQSDDDANGAGSSFGYLRLLRLVRLLRVLRIVRIMRFVAELRKLVCSIGSSLQSLAWTVVLLIYVLYVAAVCFTQLVANHMRGDILPAPELGLYFGSLGHSLLSLFQAISGGVDWEVLCRPLGSIHVCVMILFSFYIAFAVLAMMNVVTGVFVDSALQSSAKDQEQDLILRMREFYHKTSLDNGGSITWDEFEHHLKDKDSLDYFKNIGVNIAEAKSLFELLDVNEQGVVDGDEFVMGCLRLRGPARSVDLTTLMYDNKRMLGKLQHSCERVMSLLQAQQRSSERYSNKPGRVVAVE